MSINQSYRRVSPDQSREFSDGVPATMRRWFGPPLEELLMQADDERYQAWNQQ